MSGEVVVAYYVMCSDGARWACW